MQRFAWEYRADVTEEGNKIMDVDNGLKESGVGQSDKVIFKRYKYKGG